MYVDKVGGMPEPTSVIKANLLNHLQYNGKIFLVHLNMPKTELHDSSEGTFSLFLLSYPSLFILLIYFHL